MENPIQRGPAGAGKKPLRSTGLAACAAGFLFCAGAFAADGKPSDAQARYQQDRAVCLKGESNQDRATCLREAAAALQEARRGGLGGSQPNYEENRVLRCGGLPGAERDDCLRRMRGEGTVSGSVEGGGIYRELVTRVPAK